MTIRKIAPEQPNVLDGTVYAYEPVPGDGVYATVAGRDGQVYIVAFDMRDLATLHKAANEAFVASPDEAGDDLSRITNAGIPFIADLLGDSDD